MGDSTNTDNISPVLRTKESTNPDDYTLNELIQAIRLNRTNSLKHHKEEELNKLNSGQAEVEFLTNLRRVLALGKNKDGSFDVNEELKKLFEKADKTGNENFKGLLKELSIDLEKGHFSKDKFKEFFKKLTPEQKHKLQQIGVTEGSEPTAEQWKQLNDLRKNEMSKVLEDLGIDFEKGEYDQDKFKQLFKHLAAEHKEKLNEFGIEESRAPTQEQWDKLKAHCKEMEKHDLNKIMKSEGIIGPDNKFSKDDVNNIVDSIKPMVDQRNQLNEMSIQHLTRLESEMNETYQLLMAALKPYHNVILTMARGARGGGG